MERKLATGVLYNNIKELTISTELFKWSNALENEHLNLEVDSECELAKLTLRYLSRVLK